MDHLLCQLSSGHYLQNCPPKFFCTWDTALNWKAGKWVMWSWVWSCSSDLSVSPELEDVATLHCPPYLFKKSHAHVRSRQPGAVAAPLVSPVEVGTVWGRLGADVGQLCAVPPCPSRAWWAHSAMGQAGHIWQQHPKAPELKLPQPLPLASWGYSSGGAGDRAETLLLLFQPQQRQSAVHLKSFFGVQ